MQQISDLYRFSHIFVYSMTMLIKIVIISLKSVYSQKSRLYCSPVNYMPSVLCARSRDTANMTLSFLCWRKMEGSQLVC